MNKQAITILVTIAVLVVIAIAAMTFRSETVSEPTPQEEGASMETTQMEGDEPSAMMELEPIENGSYTVNPEESTVEWEGRKTLVNNYHDRGTIQVASGDFHIANGEVTGGTVTFDMNSIATTYVTMGSGEENLDRHLKSPDFFDVETHPTATFAVIGSEPGRQEGVVNVRGNLTIKGTTAETVIPVQLGMKEGNAIVTGSVDVDRTVYDVRFGSDKFFDNLADNVIDDFFTLEFTLAGSAE